MTEAGAASCSSSRLGSSSTDHSRYEVFLSFRGDTRFNFTDHLHNALLEKGIKTFRDADELRKGEEVSPALLKAIEDSRVSIIVFSENYASSKWCLEELVKIMKCKKSHGQEVRAIFYKVDPCHVRHQKGAFGDAFAKLSDRYANSMAEWKSALKDAADLYGWPIQDGESEVELIKKIVGELFTQVINPLCKLHVAEHPIGLDSYRQDVTQLLRVEEKLVHIVGIWGPGGIGKTTIAKHVFNSIHHKFDASCFLKDVRSTGLAQLQETLLFDILRNPALKVRSFDQGVNLIKTRMQHKKVLLILDDVSDSSQLKNLFPSSDCFGPGSRVLLTTRDSHLLTAHPVHVVYEVKGLDDVQALELFSLHAFKKKGPPGAYAELTRRAVFYAQGLPLALTIFGSHLCCCKAKDEWEATLGSYTGGEPHMKIRNILKTSYDALGVDLKGYFLDIACFFNGKYVDDVRPILEACYDLKPASAGIEQLQRKALITIERDDDSKEREKNRMHHMIEDMGKDIVYQASPDEAGERSRLWRREDVDNVLENNTGTSKVIGIQVQYQQGKETIRLNPKSFKKMKSLRYFSSSNFVEYSGNIDFLSSELRWLTWWRCPIRSFPSNFNPKKLVALKIRNSPRITLLWEGKNCPFLTSMDLSHCKSLSELPNFTRIPNLKELIIDGCIMLEKVHPSVGSLDKLVTLSLRSCTGLVEIPEFIGKLESLRYLDLSGNGFTVLHQSIGNLSGLEVLNVSECSKLVTFPAKASISHGDTGSVAYPNLRELKISNCFLSTVDFIGTLDCLNTLEKLEISGNNFVSVPALNKFANLREIHLYCCKKLKEIPELPPNICQVIASGCDSLDRFFIFPVSLNVLELGYCHRFGGSEGYDTKKIVDALLTNEKNSPFSLVLPGSEVPKWFQCSKDVAAGTCDLSFEIQIKSRWENIGMAVCSVSDFFTEKSYFRGDFEKILCADISIDGVHVHQCFHMRHYRSKCLKRTMSGLDHLWVTYIPLSGAINEKVDPKACGPYICQVQFHCAHMKCCGVHLVCQPPIEDSFSPPRAVVELASPSLEEEPTVSSWLSSSSKSPKRHGTTEESSIASETELPMISLPTPVTPPKRQRTQ